MLQMLNRYYVPSLFLWGKICSHAAAAAGPLRHYGTARAAQGHYCNPPTRPYVTAPAAQGHYFSPP